jgi:hypothetical protein
MANAGESVVRVGILRLRKAIRDANRLASLRMTEIALVRMTEIAWFRMTGLVLAGVLGWGVGASATTYYVSSSAGNDANSGTSSAAAWATVAKVNAQIFVAGDQILFRRGDVWNESLTPGSSGTAGSPIAFDAYGTGPAPNLTGYYAVPSAAWTLVSGNAWKAALPATYSTINFCLFGTVWGQKVAASTANLTGQWDFYFASGHVYVFSVGNPGSYYGAAIVPMAVSNVPVIGINGQSWLTFQHFLVNWFDQYGVSVQGASDHLVFANMESDSMIPQGTQPLGFYVNESTPGPADIKIYNAEAHMNYDGFRFDGAATGIAMVNDKAYANRDAALVDNTGAVNYSYCHFYASSLAVAGSTDVLWTSGTGPTAGAGNVGADTVPAVQAFQRYPAEITLTVDDIGMTPGADTYYATTVLPIADAAAVPVGTAITVGYSATIAPIISEIQGWINAGRDVTSHSISHTYYTNTDALEIQYTGSGTAATLSISGKTLTITVTGASDSVSYNLAQGQPQGTILGLIEVLGATGKFTTAEVTPCQGPYGTGCSAYTAAALLTQDLADVSGQDVKSAVYHMQLDVTRLTTDEITLSRQWMTANLTGLPATPVYVYPGGYETVAMQGITAATPYSGARGALKEDLGVSNTYASGFDVQNITSFGVNPSWEGLQPAVLNQKIQALVWKEMVWGVPWGIFWHLNELTNTDPVGGTEITNLIQDFKNAGATVRTNTGLVNWLLSGTQETGTDGNAYYKSAGSGAAVDFRPTASSPVVDAGQNLGAAYQTDINGVNQNNYGVGWEIGAHAFIGYSVYGGNAGGSFFAVGGEPEAAGVVQLPQSWANGNEAWGTTTNAIYFPASGSGGAWSCGATNYGPYTVSTQASLGQAVMDAESCRTANGSGTKIVIPHGSLFSGASGILLPQTAGDSSTNFIILTSDTPLPAGQTVCSHGTQDVVAESAAQGYRNFGCTGQNLSYQLGTTITGVAANSNYNDVAAMWTVEYTSSNQGIAAGSGSDGSPAHNFAIVNAEIRPVMCTFSAGPPPTCAGGNANSISPVKIGAVNANLLTASTQFHSHIHFYGVYAHGDWTETQAAGYPVGTSNGVNSFDFESCQFCSVEYSYVDRALRPGAESHIIQCFFCQTFKVVHNWFEGASIGTFCGGQGGNLPLSTMVGCTDVEDRANRYTYPYDWMTSTANPNNNGANGYVRKNASEIKNGLRYLRDGNIYENVDNTGAQNGVAFTFRTSQCSSGLCDNYWLLTRDVTMTNLIFRNACNGPSGGDGGSDSVGNGGGISLGVGNINFSNNLGYNLGYGGPRCSGSSPTTPFGFKIGPSNVNWSCVAASASAANSDGTTAITLSCTGVAGAEQLDFSNGDVVSTSGCSDTTFNTSTTGLGPQAYNTSPASLALSYNLTGATLGESGITCTLNGGQGKPNYVSIAHNTIAASGAAGGMAASLYNSNGGAPLPLMANATIQNNLFLGLGSELTQGAGITAAYGEGTRTLDQAWDPLTLNANNNVLASRSLSGMVTCVASTFTCTLVSGDAPNAQGARMGGEQVLVNGQSYPVHSLSSSAIVFTSTSNPGNQTNVPYFWSDYTDYGGAFPGSQPAESTHMPTNVYCIGGDPTAESCVGLVGAMSTSSYPLALADWHGYRLCHAGDAACNAKASPFAAGQVEQAADETDQGSNLAAIDAAETSTRYQCATPCGSGPMRDVTPQIQIIAPVAGASVPAVNTYLKPSPYINGIVYSLYWACSDQDGTSAHYTWTNFDSQVTADGWAAAGKKIIVVLGAVTYGGGDDICYGGTGFGTSGVGNYGTPTYVWTALGAANYTTCGGEQIPNYLNSAYLNNYQNWVAATLAHLAGSAYGASIQYVRVAWGKGGETTPIANWDVSGNCPDSGGNNTLTTDWGYTLSAWETFLHNGMTFEAGLNLPLQLMISITPMGPNGGSQATIPNFTAPIAASLHIGFGTQGLMASNVNNIAGCGGNWCGLFATYAGQVPLETQTFYQSCAASNESGACPSMAVTTGPLNPLLTWAAQEQATTFEMYYEDALSMLAPGYTSSGYAAYPQPGYLTALQSVVSGNY